MASRNVNLRVEGTKLIIEVDLKNALAKGIVEWRGKVAVDPNTKVAVSGLVMEEANAPSRKRSGWSYQRKTGRGPVSEKVPNTLV